MATAIVLKTANPHAAVTLQSLGGLVVPANGGTTNIVPDYFTELDLMEVYTDEIKGLIASADLIMIVDTIELSIADADKQMDAASMKDTEAILASGVSTTVTNFVNILTSAETNTQLALEKLAEQILYDRLMGY